MYVDYRNAPSGEASVEVLSLNEGFVSRLRKGFRERFREEKDSGQSMVEFALVLPVLLLVVTGITTFGLALSSYLQLTDAVSIGARQLAICRSQCLDPCATTSSAIINAAPQLKKANMTFTYTLNGVGGYSGTTCASTSYTTGAPNNLVQGQPAVVKVTYPCSLAVYGKNYAPSCTMTAQTTELVQ
jgi:Flp pilus assembly protein TadG